jgi:hemolysin III
MNLRERIKLVDRLLPDYTKGEEIMNMVTHIVGGGIGVLVLVLCVLKAAMKGDVYGVVGSAIYGGSMVALYAMSSIYHGLRPSMGKKVLQVLDHCTIYFLIAGTYTALALSPLREYSPWLGWGMLVFQWGMTALAVTLTAIDLKKYNVFSMICYIGMGWAILPFMNMAMEALTMPGFWLLLSGGIAYTVGSILYGIGSKVHWMHSVFHIFVVIGSVLQFLSILLYGL